MASYFEKASELIRAGEEYVLYLVHCKACKKYRRIVASPPAGPGGTLGCPVCKELEQNGPHLEGAYGNVRAKPFRIVLPKDVDL